MPAVRIGVIGLGEVAQIIHLPIIQSLSERFELVALCDLSGGLLEAVGRRYGVARLYRSASRLLEESDIEAVLIATNDEYHAEIAVEAAEKGKHVLVEKPICLTLADAERMRAARDAGGVQVMVGYMRRYAPAFTEAVAMVRELERISFVRVRDIIGQNRLMIEQTSRVLRFDDLGDELLRERARRAESMLKEAIGEVSPEIARAYRLLAGLSSHDISAMRELIGRPRRVLSAAQWNGGRCMLITFDYGEYYASLETMVDSQRRFDAHIEIYAPAKSLRIDYDTPYIRHLPTTLSVAETSGDAYRESVVRPTFTDPYTHELEQFHEAIVSGKPAKTTIEDAMEDLALFREIVAALKKTERGR